MSKKEQQLEKINNRRIVAITKALITLFVGIFSYIAINAIGVMLAIKPYSQDNLVYLKIEDFSGLIANIVLGVAFVLAMIFVFRVAKLTKISNNIKNIK